MTNNPQYQGPQDNSLWAVIFMGAVIIIGIPLVFDLFIYLFGAN